MPTPPKPTNVILLEGKSHRTKKELAERKRAEAQLLTGKILKEAAEVKENEKAHKEFQRIRKLLKSIEKDDDLYGATINRYCLLMAECSDFQDKRETMYRQMQDLQESKEEFERNEDLKTYYMLQSTMQKNMIALDRQVQTKRKMLLDIEKENIMTIASSLRSVPKKTDKKKNPLMEALTGGN
nr:MAG TPA: control of competence regulator [Caudoviricetes sp.]